MLFYTGDCILLSIPCGIFLPAATFGKDRDQGGAPHVDSQHLRKAYWIFRAGDVTYRLGQYHGSHGNALPDFGLQERSAAGYCGAAALRPALYALAGGKLRGDAARRRSERSPGSPADIMRFITENGERLARVPPAGCTSRTT